MKIYVSGPMTGFPEFNFPAFDAAAAHLRSLGHEVFSPAEKDRELGFDPRGLSGFESLNQFGLSLRELIRADLVWICEHAEALVYLPGALQSRGAIAEIRTANALGIPVLSLEGVGTC